MRIIRTMDTKDDAIAILDAGIAAFEEEIAEEAKKSALIEVIDKMAEHGGVPSHSTAAASFYFGLLGQEIPDWAKDTVLHFFGGSVTTAAECPICEPKDRS